MRKPFIFILSLIMTASFVSCGSGSASSSSSSSSSAAETSAAQSEESSAADSSQSSSQSAGELSAAGILDSVKLAYGESYMPNTPITEEMLSNDFGITPDMYTEIAAEMPMIGFHPDRVIILKAAEGKADEAEEKLNAARNKMIEDSVQYPANIAKVNASQVVRNGDYVAFFLVGAPDDRPDPSEEDALEFAKSETAKAVDAFNGSF